MVARRNERKTRVGLVQLISSGAFAGEFFNPNIGVKKRGVCKRKAPLTDKQHALSQKTSHWEVFLLSVLDLPIIDK